MSRGGVVVLDIETVPDPELYEAPPPAPDGSRPFPPLYACKPVVIGALALDGDLALTRIGVIGEGKDEAGMIADFGVMMLNKTPQLVTWNGRGFDLPVLMLRALRHGVSCAPYYEIREYRYRFSGDGHLDLVDYLTDFGAGRMISLDGAARLIGLPGKGAVDGGQVAELVAAGRLEDVRRYCLSDVAQTAFVYLRQRLLVGAISLERYRSAARALLDELARDPRLDELVRGIDRARLLLTAPEPPAVARASPAPP